MSVVLGSLPEIIVVILEIWKLYFAINEFSFGMFWVKLSFGLSGSGIFITTVETFHYKQEDVEAFTESE